MNRRWKALATGALVAFVACDIPTSPPKWDQLWVVPAEDMSLSVAELLPTGVALTPDSSAFLVTINGTAVSFTLADFCSLCSVLNGSTAPKPAFDTTVTTVETLPANVVSATASGGQFSLTVQHQLNFDPLRPAPSDTTGSSYGYMTIVVRSAGRVVARDSVNGADPNGALPASTPRTFNMPVIPGTIADSLVIEVHINSPAGDPVLIDTSEGLDATLAAGTVDVSQATVAVNNITADGVPTTMNLSQVDSSVINHVQSGALRITVSNPFNVSGGFTLTLDPPGGVPVTQTLNIQPGDFDVRLEYTAAQLQSLLGQDSVTVTTTGTLTAGGGTVTVSPTDAMTFKTQLELSVLLGGQVQP